MAIDLVRDGILDFMIVPQDDSSPYGLTAKDQQAVRSYITDGAEKTMGRFNQKHAGPSRH